MEQLRILFLVLVEILVAIMYNSVVLSGLFASIFVLGIVMVANSVQATEWSPVNDATFSNVFGLTGIAVGASMLAYLLAQFIDIRVFHFWKKLTNGKHLWLRNNASTFSSQLVDTATVLVLLCLAGGIAWDKFWVLLLNGFLFKVIMALIDTPILYLVINLIRKRFKLEVGKEIEI